MTIVIAVMVGFVYFGNFTLAPESKKHPVAEKPQGVSFESYEQMQLSALPADQSDLIKNLKFKFSKAEDDSLKSKAAHELAHAWKDLGQMALEAYYHYEAALVEKDSKALEETGDSFFSQFRISQDTLIKNNLSIFALRSYEAALKFQPNNTDLKVKTGSAYVEGSSEPMKGISLIREVLAVKPNNVPALLTLGRFSILSGQYDKAKERLDEVLKLEPGNAEAIYFMAITQEGLGNIDKAIELLEICKQIVGNTDFDKEVNAYIENLKNKKNK